MAKVVINAVRYNVNGSVRDQYYSVSGASGDTLTVGYFGVRKVTTSPGSLITASTIAAGTIAGTSVITLTSSAPMVAERIQIIGN